MRLYEFNGQQMTTTQIREIVPCLSMNTIREHLHAGRNTTDAMLNYFPAKPSAKPPKASQFCIGKSPGYERDAPSKMR